MKQGSKAGAGEGNRTLVLSLGSSCSTIELHPLKALGSFAALVRLPSGGKRTRVDKSTSAYTLRRRFVPQITKASQASQACASDLPMAHHIGGQLVKRRDAHQFHIPFNLDVQIGQGFFNTGLAGRGQSV